MDPADSLLIGFKGHLRVETVPAEAVYLISERGVTALSGPSIERLAPLLDGTRSLEQVKREVAPDLPEAEVSNLVTRLSDASLIGFRSPPSAVKRDAAADAYWQLAGLDADQVASALDEATVEIVAVGAVDAAAAAEACAASGLPVSETGSGQAAFSLVLCENYLDAELDAINARHLAGGRPWLLAKPVGPDLWTGPVFEPGTGACWACMATRLQGNRHSELLVQRVLGSHGRVRPPRASLRACDAVGIQMAALETAKWLAGVRNETQNAIHILDTLTMNGRHHAVARRPQCSVCGDVGLVSARASKPVAIRSRPKTAPAGNGHRTLGPEQVLEAYGHLVDPVTGIVSELRRDPRGPSFLHSYLSGPNRAMAAGCLAAMRAGLRAQSGGKGATDIEARVGALCEAIERYCGSRFGDEPVLRGRFTDFGPKAVHPDDCQLFDERQFADRARWNAVCADLHHVPEPFDDEAVIDWTPMWSLVTNEQKLLPTELLYYNSDPARRTASLLANSNGNAAGTSLEDAIVQGFFEVVERDAVALWWYNRTPQPAVDLDSFCDPWVVGLRGMYERLNREIWVLDVTSDLGIPAMAAVSRRIDKPAEDILLGFGAHFDPHVALRRALTEVGQMLPAVVNTTADGRGYGVNDSHLMSWWMGATVDDQPYLAPGSGPAVRAADYSYTPRADLAGDIDEICAIARRADRDILVLDQTRPDINLPVVKVVVPGLRMFWPRFAPGRLFDVPVHLGRLAEPTPYDQLNPIPLNL
jgi:oxazoline/thiazoline synthase